MNVQQHLHTWDLSMPGATALQRELAAWVEARPPLGDYELIAGADVSYNRFSDVFYAVVVVLRRADAAVVEVQRAVRSVTFPYQPGYLSFREAPVLLEAFARVTSPVDVVMIDGQGVAHPRRLGIASHLGLWLDVPTFGCAKSILYGRYKDLGESAGSLAPLMGGKDQVGCAVRTKKKVTPVYVSVGHHIDLASAVRVTLEMTRGYRLPEPTRVAHREVNAFRRECGVE